MNEIDKASAVSKMRADALRENLKAICDKLRDHGITYVTIEYSGSGDDGGQHDIAAYKGDLSVAINSEVKGTVAFKFFQRYSKDPMVIEKIYSISDAIENLGDECIDFFGHSGYENNDGGCGRIEISVEGESIQHKHSDYVVESVDSEHEFC